MPRRPSKLLPPTAEKAELKGEPKESEKEPPKGVPSAEKPQILRPGTRGPDGKRVPPPPHPKGTRFPGPRPRGKKAEELPESLKAFKNEVRLRTRHECERACERIVNWIKADVIDANKGNAMLNGVGKVLQSKTDTEQMALKVADRDVMTRLSEMEERVGVVEERSGGEGDGSDKIH